MILGAGNDQRRSTSQTLHIGSLVIALLLGLLVGVVRPPVAHAATGPVVVDAPNTTVSAIAVDNGVTYLGGNFTKVGPSVGQSALLDATTGVVDRTWPVIQGGTVRVAISDGSSGYYIGGAFTSVGGYARSGLAHIRSDNTLDPSWAPTVSGGTVVTMALDGTTIYLGGGFTAVNGSARNRAAAVTTSGTLTSWDPNVDSSVNALAVSGSRVYLGGNFANVGGAPRIRAASVATGDTATVSDWDPNVVGTVYAVVVSGDWVYLGGSFSTAGGNARGKAAAFSTGDTATLSAWNPNFSSTVLGLAVSGATIYAAGNFTWVGSAATTRRYAASVSTDSTATVSTWNPNLNASANAITVSGSTVYLGGQFNTVGPLASSTTRNYAAAFTTGDTATVTSWDPNPTGVPQCVGVSGTSTVIGLLTPGLVNTVSRNYAASLDSSGRVTSWNPNVNGSVMAMVIDGSTIYLGGAFGTVNSTSPASSRSRAAAFSTGDTATLRDWNPNLSDYVYTMLLDGSTIYVGGAFHTASGTTRNHAAAFSTGSTATLSSWDPNLDGAVRAMAVGGSTMYLGGEFTVANGNLRNFAAAYSTGGTATLTDWDPNLNGTARALGVSGAMVYVAGDFTSTTAGSTTTTRNYAAAFSTGDTATVSAWDPNLNASARTLALSTSTVYVGGYFTTAGSSTRGKIAAFATGTAATLSGWNPNLATTGSQMGVTALILDGTAIWAGGSQGGPMGTSAGPSPWATPTFLAKFSDPTAAPAQAETVSVSGTTISWAMANPIGVTQYNVMYRAVGSGKAWGVYATGTGLATNTASLTNPGTRGTCSAANTALGYTNCAMPYGWTNGTQYEFAVYARSSNGRSSVLPLISKATVTPSAG